MNEMNTEQQIKQAAKKIFSQRGFAGARMQDIADEAGINKAMLHYYFRSKQQLFEVIFDEALKDILPQLNEIVMEEGTIMDKLEHFISFYIETLKKNPHVPLFVMHELSMDPDKLVNKLTTRNDLPKIILLIQQIQMAGASGEIKPIHPIQLILNVVSMSVFPFIARPMIMAITQIDDATFEAMMESRKAVIVQFVRDAISPD